MTAVRIFLVLLFFPAFIVLSRSIGSRSKAIRTLLLFAFPSMVGYSILFPETWQSIANILGIDQGADLLLYISVLTLVTYIGYSFAKFRYLEKRIAVLVQVISLKQNEENQK